MTMNSIGLGGIEDRDVLYCIAYCELIGIFWFHLRFLTLRGRFLGLDSPIVLLASSSP